MSRFYAFLEESIDNPEAIADLQEFMGYCLMPETAGYRKALALSGPGLGKSTLCRVIESVATPAVRVSGALLFGGCPFTTKLLDGASVAVVHDAERYATMVPEACFKPVVCGDALMGAVKHANTSVFYNTCKLVFDGASPAATDDALNRFCLTIHFNGDISRLDPHLFPALEKEDALIRQWALEGRERLMQRGGFRG